MEPTTPNYSSSNNNNYFSSFDSSKSLGDSHFNFQLDEVSCFTNSSTSNNLMIESTQSSDENAFANEENLAVLRSILQSTEEI